MDPRKQAIRGLLDEFLTSIRQADKTSIVPAPNRWFAKPEDFPHQQPMIEKALAATGKSRNDFLHGAYLDPRTGQDLTGRMMSDVGAVIDPNTGRPVMSGRESGLKSFAELEKKLGNQTLSNLVRRSKFKPLGGDPLLNDIPFITTVESGPHFYGLGMEYASPTQLFQIQTGDNPHLRPKSRGDVFGMGEVVGRMQIGKGPEHDVYEKLFVAPRGSDVPGKKLSKAEGGEVHAAGGGLKQAVRSKIDEFLAELNKPVRVAPKAMQQVLPVAERDANLEKFLEPSAVQMRLYHGTPATEGGKGKEAIRRIKPSKEGALGSGSYLTPDPRYASGYANEGDANVLPVYAQLKNPLKIEGTHGDPMIEALVKLGMGEDQAARMVEKAYDGPGYIGKQVQSRAQAAGYDGLVQYRDGTPSEVVVYNPNAIKSATGNQGTYDTSYPDLNKAAGGEVHMADGGDPMLADLIERYNTPLNKSRYSAGIFDSKAPGEVRSVTPTVKERMASGLQAAMEAAGSDRYKARQRAQTIVGGENSRLPLGYGVLDIGAMVNPTVAAAMIPVYAESAMHDLANVPNALKRGDYIGAGVETGFGLMDLIPAVGQGKRVAKGVARGIKDAVTSDAGYDLAQKVLNATGTAPAQIMMGPMSKTWRKADADLAVKMEGEGRSANDIWRKTGTFRAPDGRLRQEIADENMKYTSGAVEKKQYTNARKRYEQAKAKATTPEELNDANDYWNKTKTNAIFNLTGKSSDFVNHPELFAAYPELAKYAFKQLEPTHSQFTAPETVYGFYSPTKQRITINTDAPYKRSTALHELQHAIQDIEGWQSGSSPEYVAAKMAERDVVKREAKEIQDRIDNMRAIDPVLYEDLIKNEESALGAKQYLLNQTEPLEGLTDPYEAYKKMSGEEEARMVQARRDYDERSRRDSLPIWNYETPPPEQITKDFATGGAVMMAGGKDVTKEAIKQGIKTAVTTADDFIKKLYGNKPTGEVNYVTAQEGPFYRINPVGAGEGQASRTGVREVTGTGEGTGSGGTGTVRGKVAKRYSPEEVARLVRENNIARRAAEKFGGTQTESLLTTMPPTSLAKQGAIGRAFMEASTDNPQYKQAVYEAYGRQMPELMETIGARDYDDLMDKAYRQLNYETAQQFNQMPVNMSFHRAGEGDYRSSGEMLEDVHGNKHLYVFQGGEPHNMMSDVDPRTGLNQTEQFRAVHDLFGHAVHGNEFGPKGEELAFGAHSQMYSPLARIALATETRGQNSVVNYTPLNVELKAELAKLDALRYEAMRRGDEGLANEIAQQKRALYGENFQYSPNRGLLLPPEFTDPMYEGGLPEYMSGIFRPSQGTSERLTHFSHDPSLTMTDPSRYGTGIRGEELYRLQGSKAPVMDRTYFYRGDNPRPETGLGRYRYGTQGEDLYSMASDPERLGLLAREANRMPFTARSNQGIINEDQALTDFERLAKEYGYEGLLGDRAAIMYNPASVERYAHGGQVHMAAGGNPAKQRVKEVIKSGAEAIDDFLNSLKTRGAERVSPNYTNTALSDQQQRLADQIAQANPKLAAEDVQKKALQQAQKKLEWERTEKPGIVKSYGALTPTSYSANKLQKMRNTSKVVQNRIDEANRFLDQPTEAWTPPPPELQAFDRSSIKDALAGFPGVQQSTFPRDIPSRSSTSYVEELYEDPKNRELIKKQIMRGLPLGGETFYASLYPVKQATLEAGMAPDAFERWIHSLAPASARNSIMNEMAVGQFLRDMNAKGIPLTEANVLRGMEDFKNTYGMGLPLMPIHRQGVADVLEGGRNLRDMSLANIPTNYKIPTYGTQKAGDFGGSVVLDTHEASGETLGSRYHPYFSEQGGFSNAEYHPGEQGMLSIARELGGLPGGMAQAGRWFGGGELTGLISPRGDALDLLEKQIAYTLHNQGRQANPANIRKEVLDQIRTGEGLILPWWMRGGMPDYRTTGLQRKEGGDVSLDDFLANLESTH